MFSFIRAEVIAILIVLLTGVVAVADSNDLREAISLRSEGRNREAVKILERITAASPRNVRAVVQLGAALEDLRMWSKAATAYGRALYLDPTNKSAKRNLDHLVASRVINRPLNSPNPTKRHLIQKGIVSARHGDFETALNAFRLLSGLFPNDPSWSFYRALVMEEQGDHRAAADLYEKVISAAPGYAPAWTNLIVSLYRSGDKNTVPERSRKALELLPGDRRLKSLARLVERNQVGRTTHRSRLRSKQGGAPQ